MCVSLPETTTTFDDTLGTQDAYSFTAQEPPPSGGGPTIWERLQSLEPGAWRELGDKNYNDTYTSAVSPVNYYWDQSGTVRSLTGWDFRSLDKMLSEAPAGTPKEVDEEIPLPLYYCSSGSWSNSSTGCNPSGPGALTDQSYGQVASFYANLVRYFRTGVLASGSGSTSFTANGLRDTSRSFAGYGGDCVTATVMDSYGFPDWVTGTIASVGGTGDHEVTLTADWSSAQSYDAEAGQASIPSNTPAAGAAYNVASCTPPGGLASPQDAEPWPLPPSVGNVQYFELFNEPDLSNINQLIAPPAVLPPTTISLTGVDVAGGTLTPGDKYTYEIASDGVQASGVYCANSRQDNTCGGWSLPSSKRSITLPRGDNAVTISWSEPTPNDGAMSYAYQIYGRGSSNQLGIAVVGRSAAGGRRWTDTGHVQPTGSPAPVDESSGGNVITPAVYYQLWNVAAPAMKAVSSTIKLDGPAEANTSGYGEPSVDTACATTDGPNSACKDGNPGWKISTDYIPTLMKYANPLPDVVTFHGYGTACCDTPESPNFSSISSYEIAHFNSTDKAAVQAKNIPIWIDEADYSATNAASRSYRSMTQVGSAWLADDVIQWAKAEPLVHHIVQWAANSGDPSWELFSTASLSGNSSCLPQPACKNLTRGEPDLEYWSIYEINHLLAAGGKLVPVSNVPSGFEALAVQTGAHTVVVLLVNIQQGNDDGNGASGTVHIRLAGDTVSDVERTAINGSTSMRAGPATSDLGARSNVTIDAAGYEVDLLKFTVS